MSSIPQPPSDPELHHHIDSVAAYIAKCGPASEEQIRQQHYGNPHFAFLAGGEYSDYYKFRLLCEVQNLQQVPPPGPPPPQMSMALPPPLPPPSNLELEERQIEEKIQALRNQITESESNLKAHEVNLNVQKQAKVETLWRAQEDKRIGDLVKQVGLNIGAFDKLLDKLNESGSKETISNTKKWIFDNCNSDRSREIILTYLQHRVRERTASDAFRLHVLYLINDWAHYCQRKKMDSMRQMLSRYVPKLYSYASTGMAMSADTGYAEKLEKLFGVWEGHKYFDESCYKQLRNPSAHLIAEQAAAAAEQQQLWAEVDKELGETLGGYVQQHKEYEQHVLTKIAAFETQLREIRDKIEAEREHRRRQAEEAAERAAAERQRFSRFDQPPPAQSSRIPSLFEGIPPPPPQTAQQGQPMGIPPGPQQQAVHGHFPPPPTPNHVPVQQQKQPQAKVLDLVPKAPYYELPAGMMVPLVRVEDCTYQPLDANALRLPPPEPPSEQLMREIDRFYSAMQIPPPIDCIRDADGWEMNGLIEHYVKKSEQRIKLEAKLKAEGKTLEDAFTNKFVPPPTRSENGQRSGRKARSRTSSGSSSGSSNSSRSSSSGSSSRSSSSSPRRRSRSRSPSPVIKRIRRRRSRSATPEERPSFATPMAPAQKAAAAAIGFKISPVPLNRETNKGAQLMAKMGWEGRGLGAKEQGIEEPITGGEVRDKSEQFRGLGSKPDIFEEYRKQMSSQMSKRLQKF